MPLTLVLGPANSAKAGEVLGAYVLAARSDALLVVPTAADVAHYERELSSPGVTLGRATTFPGLIEEIALRARHRRERLTPLQRDRVLRRAIASLRLQTLAGPAGGGGFARAAGRLIAELEQGRVSAPRLATAMRDWAGAASERVAFGRELSAIYRRYLDELAKLDRADAEGFAWGALDALRERPARWGGTPVFLYGFDDLTPIELDAVETLSRQADAAVTVSLTYEPGRPALAARATVVEELRASAQSVTQLPALDHFYASDARAALHHLERNLFEPDPPAIDPGDAVALMEAGGERAEAELVAAEVLAALGAGVPAEEIVVVCRSLVRSGELFERALARQGVATVSARLLPLAHTALGRALLGLVRWSLLPAAQRRSADLLAYLRHPGVVDPPDAVDRLEADLRQGGRGEIPDTAALSARGPALRPALEAIEALRQASDHGACVAEIVPRLLAAPHRRRARVLSGAEQLDAAAAATVLDALAQIRRLDGDRALPPAELVELLEGLQVPAHRVAPAGAVLVAEPLAIRARRFRRVFVTGLCEGEFPAPQTIAPDPFLGDDRRRELALASGLVLPQAADPLDRERYLLYACVSRATERVTFSYRSSDEDGNVVMASPFLDDLAELFTASWRERRRRRLLADVVWSIQDAPSEWERLLASAYAEAPAVAPAAAAPATRLLSEQALTHVRHRQIVSAGALEMFASCPVRWLVERQLEIDRLEPDAEPLTRGSFIHALLERVFARLGAPLTARTLPRAESLLREEIERCGGDGVQRNTIPGDAVVAAGNRIAIGHPPQVRAAILRGVEAELRRYLRHEAADGREWVPLRTELRFGLDADVEGAMPPVALDDGRDRILLGGIVDRVDADPDDPGRVIVRDYKSGAKRDSWPAARWLEDRQIQVALYMIAVQRLLEVRVVAGFYQPLTGEDLRERGVYTAGIEAGAHAVFRDERTEGELEELLDEIEDQAVELAATLQRGELTPCPETCTPEGSCRHPGICWAER
jgi:hypothetical protein